MNINLLKEIIAKVGGDVENLPDNLLTTHLKALCEALGVDTSNVKDNLITTLLRAMHCSDVPDDLLTTHLKALCETLEIDTSDIADNLTSSYLQKILDGEISGGGSGGGYASQLYEHFGVNIVEEPILIIGVVAYAGLNFTDVTIYFTDKIEDWGSTMVAMTNGYYSQYVRINGTELLYTDEDIVTKLLETLTNLVPNLTYNTVAKGVSYAESIYKTALTNLDVDIDGVITIK